MQDRLFLLSLDEYNKYVAGNRKYTKIRVPLIHKDSILGDIVSKVKYLWIGDYKDIYDEWMLRTTHIGNIANSYYIVQKDGRVSDSSPTLSHLIRPAMKINVDFPDIWDELDNSVRRNFHNGSVIKMGEFYGKPIEWYVLDEKEGLVLAKYPLFYCQPQARGKWYYIFHDLDKLYSLIPFEDNCIDIDDTKDDLYQYSYIRFCLQMLFICMFDGYEQHLIKDVKLYENENITIMAKKEL
jgi:hypothetical protein